MYDAVIIGSGPAGLSAAINLKLHEKDFIWFGSRDYSDKVEKSENRSKIHVFSERSLKEWIGKLFLLLFI